LPAVTQVKVLSPEITNVARDQGFHFLEVSINICDTCLREKHRQEGECIIDVPGSKSTAGKRTVYIGTWENHAASKKLLTNRRGESEYGGMVVGLTHSRGVNEVIFVEDIKSTRRGQQFNVKR